MIDFEPRTERVLVLISGSRALAQRQSAKAYVWRHMLDLLAPLPRPSLIIHGDCEGSPDVWSKHACERLALPKTGEVEAVPGHAWVGYQLQSGNRVTSEGKVARWTARKSGWTHIDRNYAMVLRAAAAAQDGYRVLVVGYLASWATTAGTEGTMQMAESVGLAADRVLVTPELLREAVAQHRAQKAIASPDVTPREGSPEEDGARAAADARPHPESP
jgi:hypothetical protein